MRITLLAAPLLLAACLPPAPVTPLPPPADPCGAGQYAGLVGGQLSTFDPGKVAGPVRVLTPGGVMTMDHRPDRLNIHVDGQGRIFRVTCG